MSAPLLGPFLRVPRAELVEVLALAGFDFAIADCEHGIFSPESVYPLILAARVSGIRLFARIPGVSEAWSKWLLDLDIDGLLVPHVSTPEAARSAARFASFSPSGERGLCRNVRAAGFGSVPVDQYLANANARRLLIVQIEGAEGLENAEAIVATEGVDVVFVGPYDLSQSLGIPGKVWDDRVLHGVERVLALCRAHGKKGALFTDTPAGVERWTRAGADLIAYRVDVDLYRSLVTEHLAGVRAGAAQARLDA